MPKPSKNQLTFLDEIIESKPKAIKWPRSLGAPYMGSKNSIARKIIDELPPNDYFVDLFGGGGAITHAAMLSGKFPKGVIYNDFDGSAQDIFRQGMNGELNGYNKFVTRDEFFNNVSRPEKVMFSYGNNLQDYLYAEDIEKAKQGIHNFIVPEDAAERLNACRELKREIPGLSDEMCERIADSMVGKDLHNRRLAWVRGANKAGVGERIYRQQHLENLDRINNLQKIPNKDKIQFSKKSYEDVEIPKNATVYADPPYRGTAEYVAGPFDFNAFDDWALSRNYPVYISEYNMPDKFPVKNRWKKRSLLGHDKNGEPIYRYETLYTNGKE